MPEPSESTPRSPFWEGPSTPGQFQEDMATETTPPKVPITGSPRGPSTAKTASFPRAPILVAEGASAPLPLVASAPSDDPPEDETERILRRTAPPWAVSFLWHLMMLILLAVLFLPNDRQEVFELDATFSDTLGEQLDEMVSISTLEEPDIEQSLVMDEQWEPVPDPLAALPTLEIPDLSSAIPTLDAPTIGVALNGREAGMKAALLKAYGGTAETEAAVQLALEWLGKQQRRDGSWSLLGPYSRGGAVENEVAATAMALLAFQGAGHTTERGQYQAAVKKAWYWMRSQQDKQGCFFQQVPAANHRFYTHALSTIAICELLGMTRDESFRKPAQAAIDYLVKTQDSLGGWRYHPQAGSDLSVTGWCVMALQSGRMAGLIVPSPVFDAIREFLDNVQDNDGATYGYMIRDAPSESMTAEGLLCRQYLGWAQDEPALLEGTEFLLNRPMQWRDPNLYYWYYATQVLHHMEGDAWNRWNRVLRTTVPEHQEKAGKEKGSWLVEEDRFSSFGGRLYSTCLCVYMLEVYYRHLPIYSHVYE